MDVKVPTHMVPMIWNDRKFDTVKAFQAELVKDPRGMYMMLRKTVPIYGIKIVQGLLTQGEVRTWRLDSSVHS